MKTRTNLEAVEMSANHNETLVREDQKNQPVA